METNSKRAEVNTTPAKEKVKTSFGQKFWNFLMCGGFLILLILAGVGFVVVSQLMK